MKSRVGSANDDGLPPDLSSALAGADGVLARHDRLFEVLRTTHESIAWRWGVTSVVDATGFPPGRYIWRECGGVGTGTQWQPYRP